MRRHRGQRVARDEEEHEDQKYPAQGAGACRHDGKRRACAYPEGVGGNKVPRLGNTHREASGNFGQNGHHGKFRHAHAEGAEGKGQQTFENGIAYLHGMRPGARGKRKENPMAFGPEAGPAAAMPVRRLRENADFRLEMIGGKPLFLFGKFQQKQHDFPRESPGLCVVGQGAFVKSRDSVFFRAFPCLAPDKVCLSCAGGRGNHGRGFCRRIRARKDRQKLPLPKGRSRMGTPTGRFPCPALC